MRTPDFISVWIIEDDADDRDLIAAAFEESQHRVGTFCLNNALSAIDFLKKCTPAELPNILVTDFNMPLMNGYQLLNVLDSDSKYRYIKKVVLSTACLPEDQRKCLEKGADAYITKPSRYGELVEVANKILLLESKSPLIL
ncbi:MAG: response regulator [Bacteroidota bacterium]